MKRAILFDLGNTLAEYFPRWTPILHESIARVHAYLADQGLYDISLDDLWPRVDAERREAPNYHVRPLEQRLRRIFRLPASASYPDLCRIFMRRTFALGKVYPDSIPVLDDLRGRGIKLAIVSNTPWGSPSYLWREEIHRLDLDAHVDEVVFCADVGWRKPARPIFRHALDKLGVSAEDSIFVGDDPRWDLVGPRRVGMGAIIISREGIRPEIGAPQITELRQLLPMLTH